MGHLEQQPPQPSSCCSCLEYLFVSQQRRIAPMLPYIPGLAWKSWLLYLMKELVYSLPTGPGVRQVI